MFYYLYFIFNFVVFPLLSRANYTHYEVTAYNAQERALLYYLHVTRPKIIFINDITNEAAILMDVIVRNGTENSFEKKLQALDIQYSYVSQISIESMLNLKMLSSYHYITNSFYDWNNILRWIDKLAKKSNIFKKTVIAKTYEGRDIFILNISKGEKKPIVFIVGGEDGRDWMSSALVLNLFDELIKSRSSLNILLTKLDFYLLPVLNPDGFVFSKKQDRLWSKNRRVIYPQIKCQDGNIAVGVNIARNWFFHKYSKMVDEECNSVNIGHKAFSEDESQALSYILNSLAVNMLAFIDIRGFGRFITVPYGHTTNQTNNHDIVMEILKSASLKLFEKHNVIYYLGTTVNYFYNFSGNMADWVKFKLNTPIVYTIHLEDENTVLPLPTQINTLKNQLFTVLNESLQLSQNIYRPLFNNQKNLFSFCMIQYVILTYAIVYEH